MNRFESITKPLAWFMALLLVAFVAGCGGGDGSTADTTAPTVSSTVPLSAASGVAINSNITATFSEVMKDTTVTATTFTLMQGLTPVSGVVSYAGTTASFNPTSNLTASTTYTATVSTGVKDLAGNALASNHVWSFTTGATADTTAPTVSSTVPLSSASGVAINSNIAATFNEAMDAATITTTTFTLMNASGVAASGVVSYVGTTATFNPTSNLAASTTYTATVTTGAKDLAGNALATGYAWSFTTGTTTDTVAPGVSSTVPLVAESGVAINSNITATFSEDLDAATVSTATFTLKQGTTVVPGAVTYVGTTATFNPTSNLTASTTYTATVSTGVKDLAGNALASNHVWSFTTGATADTTAPAVSFTVPIAGASGVAINRAVNAAFDEAMDAATITTTTFTLMHVASGVAASGVVTYVGKTASFNPTGNLAASAVYEATVSTGARDLAGNALASNYVWTFTTGTTADTAAPSVSSTVPLDAASGVARNSNVAVSFNEAMDAATVSTTTFTLKQGTTVVPGAVTYAGSTATFNPTGNLAASTTYTATVSTGVKDLAGNALASNHVWSFTTGTTVAAGPPAVNLLTAGDFAILANTQIACGLSCTGFASRVTGDVGQNSLNMIQGSGFTITVDSTNDFATASEVVGKLYAQDYTGGQMGSNGLTPEKMTLAGTDMILAYDDAAGRTAAVGPPFLEAGTGNLDGLTLVPGVYTWGGNVTSTTTVTLSGGPDDVWIFQIGGYFRPGNGSNMILSNPAGGAPPKAKNIFWAVAGSDATLGTTAHLEGVILTGTGYITLNAGATVNGRLLSKTAVTINGTVTQPAP